MLNYLDIYPLELPCRYTNKVACFTKVYIVSNLDLNEQYRDVQFDYPETWKAFLRRIHKVMYIDAYKSYETVVTEIYVDRKEKKKNEQTESPYSQNDLYGCGSFTTPWCE
jgi:hypothetical protein